MRISPGGPRKAVTVQQESSGIFTFSIIQEASASKAGVLVVSRGKVSQSEKKSVSFQLLA